LTLTGATCEPPRTMSQPLRIGLAGLGTVGAAVARQLLVDGARLATRAGRPLVLTTVVARDRFKDRGLDLSDVTWFDDPVAMARSADVDVVVELIGGAEGAARATVEAALAAGKAVVTANKALLAAHGPALAATAEAAGVALAFEASVAGGIPIVKTLREGLAANSPRRVVGILNGTCNYILTRMERDGLSFAECLAEAQRLGYAEADPTFDIDGHDTAHKLSLLTSLAFGTKVAADEIYLEGIRSISIEDIRAAWDLGYKIKLLGVAVRTETGIEQRVHPTMVPYDSALAQVDGVLNAVLVDADLVGQLMLVGPGAGGNATASAVLADLVDVAHGHATPPFGVPADRLAPYAQAEIQTHEGGYYVRLNVYDRPGAFAAIASRMAEARISLESIVQRGRAKGRAAGETAPVILITYETTEAAIRKALEAIERDGHIAARPQMIRIEKL
jgi:homoserine dehydrogenase